MDNSTLTKRCPRCGRHLAFAEFNKNRAKPDGLQLHCRSCALEFQRESRGRHPEKVRERGRVAMRRRRERDADAVREYQRAWREANPDKVEAARRAWATENYERLREAANAANARYKAAHPDKRREHDLRRRARKVAAKITPADLQAIWEKQAGLCGLCGKLIDRDLKWPDPMSPSVDHIIPLAKGGPHSQDNLQWTHLIENVRKGDRLTSESEAS